MKKVVLGKIEKQQITKNKNVVLDVKLNSGEKIKVIGCNISLMSKMLENITEEDIVEISGYGEGDTVLAEDIRRKRK